MLKIGKRLRELRIEKKYSQEYLAHELGMTQGNYCKLEGDKHFPNQDILGKIATLYGITTQQLLASNFADQELIWDDAKMLIDELLKSKEKIIALQEKQIQILEARLKDVTK